MNARFATRLKERGRAIGFDLIGITDPSPSRHVKAYRAWVDRGAHGEMAYLGRPDSIRRRADLRGTVAGVRSVVMVGVSHFVEDPEGMPADASRAVIARYARGQDYHRVVKKWLQELLEWIRAEASEPVLGFAYVDTGPILERELGQRAGLGWFGKNTMLIHPQRGSYFFLGSLLLDLHLPPDPPFEADHCGTCSNCLTACPTGALLGRDETGAPIMDARRCISYLTIELRGSIPRALRPQLGNRVFGCDICQEVCPWNVSFAEPNAHAAFQHRAGLDGPELIDLARWLLDVDEAGFRARLPRSPLTRTKRVGLLRNVCVALGNYGAEVAVAVLSDALLDPSALVREHAAWALGRIGSPSAKRALSTHLPDEQDGTVRTEIGLALGE